MWEKDRPQIVMTDMKLDIGGLVIIQIYLLQFACGAAEMTNQKYSREQAANIHFINVGGVL